MANQGQKHLNLDTGSSQINSIFQIAKVTRPLMSVGRITDGGYNVIFDKEKAIVRDQEGKEVCRFVSQNGKGLYVCKLKLTKPSQGFARQG